MILKDETLASDVDLDEIAARSAQYSGSDLHELCRCAAMNSFIQCVRNSKRSTTSAANVVEDDQQHVIRKVDFDVAFEKMAVKLIAMNLNARERFDFNF